MHTHTPSALHRLPPRAIPPLRVITGLGAELPVLRSGFPPATYFSAQVGAAPHSSLPSFTPMPCVCAPHPHLFSCPENSLICTTSLDST